MNIKKCDRCGDTFEPDSNYLIINAKEILDNSHPMFGEEYDLCEICQADFYEFMNKEVIGNEEE